MGAVLGKQMEKAMDENMKKQQDFMLSSQKMQVRLCGVEVLGFYRWISWYILPWELEGITLPCCLLIGQATAGGLCDVSTSQDPLTSSSCHSEKMLWKPSILASLWVA